MEMNEDTRKAARPHSRTSVGKCQLRSKLFLIRQGKEEEGKKQKSPTTCFRSCSCKMVAKKRGLPPTTASKPFSHYYYLMVLQSVSHSSARTSLNFFGRLHLYYWLCRDTKVVFSFCFFFCHDAAVIWWCRRRFTAFSWLSGDWCQEHEEKF